MSIKHLKNVSLHKYTTLKVGAKAKHLLIPESIDDLLEIPYTPYILGNGSNILSLKNIDTVIKLGRQIPASQNLSCLCKKMAREGKAGLEFAIGIPGTLGGAIKMNAGGKLGCMGDIVKTVTTVNNGKIQKVTPSFVYRSSNIPGIIVDANFITQSLAPKLIRKRLEKILATKCADQPIRSNTAGCIFKNPPNKNAGFLIEQAGLKGKIFGNVRVSPIHANFIETRHNVSAQEVMEVISLISNKVLKESGCLLELEVKLWA